MYPIQNGLHGILDAGVTSTDPNKIMTPAVIPVNCYKIPYQLQKDDSL
jgi:hypothetical protein